MKSQDILILLKLISLSKLKANQVLDILPRAIHIGWELDHVEKHDISLTDKEIIKNDKILAAEHHLDYLFTVRGLAEELGMSKSEVSKSLQRCIDVNLVKIDRITKKHIVNKKLLTDFIKYALRLVYPAKPAEMVRGIPTTFAAPILENKLLSAGEIKMVWSDHRGATMGQSIEPIYRAVPHAVKRDSRLYAYLALLDAIRIGSARESKLALSMLEDMILNE